MSSVDLCITTPHMPAQVCLPLVFSPALSTPPPYIHHSTKLHPLLLSLAAAIQILGSDDLESGRK